MELFGAHLNFVPGASASPAPTLFPAPWGAALTFERVAEPAGSGSEPATLEPPSLQPLRTKKQKCKGKWDKEGGDI